jgi:uncharacterized protein YaeQ
MTASLYRRFERALALIDRLPEPERRLVVRMLAWWVTWAERLTAHASDTDPDCTC